MTAPQPARLPCTVLSGFLGAALSRLRAGLDACQLDEVQVELDSSAWRNLPNPFPPLASS